MEQVEVDLHTFLISAMDEVQWLASAAGHFKPGGNTLVTIVGFEPETL